MAQQLIENRSPAAYVPVTRYARLHPHEDAGALAWLAVGYARLLDHQCPQGLIAFRRAQVRAGVLADYVAYFMADCDSAAGDPEATLDALKDFDTLYPHSLNGENAAVLASAAWSASRDPARGLALLEQHRKPYQPSIELAVARAQEGADNPAAAVATLQHLYYSDPAVPEAAAAQAQLAALATKTSIPQLTASQRELRARLLVEQHRPADAIPEYQALAASAAPEDLPPIQLDLAYAMWKSGRSNDAENLLSHMPAPSGDLDARRLYYLLELARPDVEKVAGLISRLRDSASTSPWFEAALASTGNMYLLRNDSANAQRFYGELVSRFPAGRNAAYANWKSAWLQFRTGNLDAAKTGFEQQLTRYSDSPQAPAALYWRGRIAEQEHDPRQAQSFYSALAFQLGGYYSGLAAARLQDLKLIGPPETDPLLAHLRLSSAITALALDAPANNLHAQEGLLLENAGLDDFAIRELEAAGREGYPDWSLVQMARIYAETGHYDRALEAIKRAAPNYFALHLSELPRPLWEGLFPRPYWQPLKRFSAQNQLDPFLVASLIRQESAFNPGAISPKQAMGLMQLLPNTGRTLAHEERLRHFESSQLLDPAVNLQLGTRYLRGLLKKYDGRLEYALAAYNAGTDRVKAWRNGEFQDMPEFVESIPFSETRNYVEAILRNQEMYQQLYGTP